MRIVFTNGPLTITAGGAPLQNAAVGDLIRVRNTDSGIIVSGTVMEDGTIACGGKMTFRFGKWCLAFFAVFAMAITPAEAASRIKDVASVQSGRENQLIGYGLVVGLQGTGDSLRSSPFTAQSLRAMLQESRHLDPGCMNSARRISPRFW